MPLFPAATMTLVRRLAQSHLLSAARAAVPMTGAEVLRTLRISDLGYRTADFYSDWAYWREGVERGKKLKYTWKGEVLSEDLYMTTGYEMKARYETVCIVTYRDVITGKTETQWVTIAHEHLEAGITTADRYQTLTRAEIEEQAAEAVQSTSPGGQPEIVSVMTVMGFVNPAIG